VRPPCNASNGVGHPRERSAVRIFLTRSRRRLRRRWPRLPRRAQPSRGPPSASRATSAWHIDRSGAGVVLTDAARSRLPRARLSIPEGPGRCQPAVLGGFSGDGAWASGGCRFPASCHVAGRVEDRAEPGRRPSPLIRTKPTGGGADPSRRSAGRHNLNPLGLPSMADGCFAPSSIRQERRPAPSSHLLVATASRSDLRPVASPIGSADPGAGSLLPRSSRLSGRRRNWESNVADESNVTDGVRLVPRHAGGPLVVEHES
jgi:hypothetical protein